MIIVRSPLRISLGGGGTDLPSYYLNYEGFLIAAAINKYVYVSINKPFDKVIFLRYSKVERVQSADEISHPIIREALKLLDVRDPFLEITSTADVPAGTGLGSSSSFTCALLEGLHSYSKDVVTKENLAEEACHIEIEVLKEPVGKQDQYVSAFGGLNAFKFKKDGKVDVTPIKMSEDVLNSLESNLLLFFTGYTRSAIHLLKEQDTKSRENDQSMVDNLHFIKELGLKSKRVLESGNLEEFAELMNVHWEYKKRRSNAMSNDRINLLYDLAMKNGALGGKIVGAGGGGFLMFYTNDNLKLRRAMAKEGLRETPFRFDFDGTKVLVQ
ncbi:MAG: kinase [Thermoplasmatales archaeon]|jgi:D-glycero-alpha-D-manno-heptose-7-phosphate kinase|nr:galactokinase [Candidatus Thermoplasmatota archaeon]MCL6002393.1 galactokinase [Candidatus Thermoplasmatota archaeon]MDA8055882.1 kinase [Thermoplasmatales archaeon]